MSKKGWINEPEALKNVRDFHLLTKNNIEEHPTIPNKNRCELRVSLIGEELRELEEAIKAEDIVEIADALCDIQYVLSGSILEFGMARVFKNLFDEVHRSNMSKACKSLKEVQETKDWYADVYNIDNTDHIEVEEGVYFVIDLDNNNKTLKSMYYKPVNIKGILDEYFKTNRI